MEFDGTEYNKEHFEKPTVSPERLAEIIREIDNDAFSLEDPLSTLYYNRLSRLLITKLDIREKE